jgi:hypothetical protein
VLERVGLKAATPIAGAHAGPQEAAQDRSRAGGAAQAVAAGRDDERVERGGDGERCLRSPSRGAVEFLGASIGGMPAHEVCACGVALVPEGGQLFPKMTVYQNPLVGAYLGRARTRAPDNVAGSFELFPDCANAKT